MVPHKQLKFLDFRSIYRSLSIIFIDVRIFLPSILRLRIWTPPKIIFWIDRNYRTRRLLPESFHDNGVVLPLSYLIPLGSSFSLLHIQISINFLYPFFLIFKALFKYLPFINPELIFVVIATKSEVSLTSPLNLLRRGSTIRRTLMLSIYCTKIMSCFPAPQLKNFFSS